MNRKLSRRHFLGLSAAGGLAALLAACAPAQPTPVPQRPPEKQGPTSAPTTAPAAAPTAAPSGKKSQVEIYTQYGGSLGDAFDKMASNFNKSQDKYEVVPVHIPDKELKTRLLAAITAGTPPSSWTISPLPDREFMRDGIVEPLDDALTPWPADIYPGYDVKVEGKRWGIPHMGATLINFYNKDQFKAAGLDPEKAPSTWDELVTFGKKLTDPAKNQYAIALTTAFAGFTFATFKAFLQQAGGKVLSDDLTKAAFNNQAGLEALTYYVSLFQTHKIAPLTNMDSSGIWNLFKAGGASMVLQYSGAIGGLKEMTFASAAAEPPMGKVKSSNLAANYFPFLKGGNKQGLAAFANWFIEPKQIADWVSMTGCLPVRAKATEEPVYKEYIAKNPVAKVPTKVLEYAEGDPSVIGYAEAKVKLGEFVEAAIYGKLTPAEALKQAEAAFNALLKP